MLASLFEWRCLYHVRVLLTLNSPGQLFRNHIKHVDKMPLNVGDLNYAMIYDIM